MNATSPLLQTWAPLAAGLLLRSALLSAAILLLVGFARRRSAAERHFVLAVGAGALLLLPLTGFTGAGWGSNLLPNPFVRPAVPAAVSALGAAAKPETGASSRTLSGPPAALGSGVAARALAVDATGTAAVMDAAEAGRPTESTDPGRSARAVTGSRLLRLAGFAWAAGTVAFLAWLATGRVLLARLLRRAVPIGDEGISRRTHAIGAALGLRRPVPVLCSDAVRVPVVAGVLRSRLVLPRSALAWPEGRLDAVLLHELAHVRRHDVTVQLLAQIVRALYWVNPLVWVAERRLLIERERACDDMVLERGVRPSAYARLLLEVSEALGATRHPGAELAGMADGTDFRNRVLSVLDPNARRSRLTLSRAFAPLVVAALVVVPLLAWTPWPATTEALAIGPKVHPGATPESIAELAAAEPTEPFEGIDSLPTLDELEAVLDSLKARQAELVRARRNDPAFQQKLHDLQARAIALPLPRLDRHELEAMFDSAARAAIRATFRAQRELRPELRAKIDSMAFEAQTAARELALRDTEVRKLLRLEAWRGIPLPDEVALRFAESVPLPIDEILPLLEDPDAEVREEAAFSLGYAGDISAIDALGKALFEDEASSVRQQAASALGVLGDRKAVPLLIRALQDSDAGVRAHAASALGRLGEPTAAPALTRALRDPDARVRKHALRALTLLGAAREP